MTEPEEDEDGELEAYMAPEPLVMSDADGQVTIFDPVDFSERHNAEAVMFRHGSLWVLDRDAQEWGEVGAQKKAPAKLRPVQ